MRTPTVHVVTAVHNGLSHTSKMVASLQRQTYPRLSILIVDDGSTDGTEQAIRSAYPEIVFLRGNGDLWWTGAMEIAVSEVLKRSIDGDFILTINNDCEFSEDFVQTLVDTSVKFSRAVTGSMAVDRDRPEKIIDPGVRIDWERAEIANVAIGDDYTAIHNKEFETEIDTITTKGTLFPIEVFLKIGNFDRFRLPHYLSDYEFGCRAKNAGFRLVISRRATVFNDAKKTGLGEERLVGAVGARHAYALLFSRRSRANIFDRWHFIRLCCPPRLRFYNYKMTLWNSLRIISHVKPFYYIRKLIR